MQKSDQIHRREYSRVIQVPTHTQGFGMTDNRPARNILQRRKEPDPGARLTRTWYSKQIATTGTDEAINEVVRFEEKPESGIFLSDTVTEWKHSAATPADNPKQISGWRLVLPDKNNPPKQVPPSETLQYPTLQNDKDVENLCEFAAEHELVHLRHAYTNNQKGNGPITTTQALSFGDNYEEANVSPYNLIADAYKLPQLSEDGSFNTAYLNTQKLIITRLQNIEPQKITPLIKELNRILTDMPDKSGAWLTFAEKIKELNDITTNNRDRTTNALLSATENLPDAPLNNSFDFTFIEAKNYIISRLKYIQKQETNSEAPAVMRELNLFLAGMPDKFDQWIPFAAKINELDSECVEALR